MSAPDYESVLRLALELPPDARRQLADALSRVPASVRSLDELEDQVEQEMLAAGELEHVPPPMTDTTRFDNWKPLEIPGPPLSQQIIEERR